MTIQDAKGSMLAEKTIATQGEVGAVNWVGFIAHAKAAGSLYIDNVILQEVAASAAPAPAPKAAKQRAARP